MKRYKNLPILTRADVRSTLPHLHDVSSIFNPGAIKFEDQFILLARVQNRGRETFTMVARSNDGIHFNLAAEDIVFSGIDACGLEIFHCYDARITEIEGRFLIMFAMDTNDGCRLGLAQTDDFIHFTFLGVTSGDDTRNGVLFPEKINGRYARFERPNAIPLSGGPTSGNTICYATSDDLLNWESPRPVASGRDHYWDELIGSGPPPIKTRQGWLHIYHGVATHFSSANIYQAGVMLHDLKNPEQVIARGRYNILEPREVWECMGQVPNVVFPSGAIVHDFDEEGYALETSEVFVYYGAADTVIGMATTTIAALIKATGL